MPVCLLYVSVVARVFVWLCPCVSLKSVCLCGCVFMCLVGRLGLNLCLGAVCVFVRLCFLCVCWAGACLLVTLVMVVYSRVYLFWSMRIRYVVCVLACLFVCSSVCVCVRNMFRSIVSWCVRVCLLVCLID